MTQQSNLRQLWWECKRSLKQGLPLVGIYAAALIGLFTYAILKYNWEVTRGYRDASWSDHQGRELLRIGIASGILFLAVGLGFLFFKYLYRRDETDLFHSLPLKRKNLFWGKFAAGCIYLWFSVLLSGALTAAYELKTVNGGEAVQWVYSKILGEFGLMLVTITAVFAFVVLAAVLASALFQGLMLFGVMTCIWPFVYAFAIELIRSTVPEPSGEFGSSFWFFLMSVLSPPIAVYIRIIRGGYDPTMNLQFLWWALVAAALCLVAYKIYVNRKTSAASVSYGLPKTVLSVLAGVAIAMAAGFWAVNISDNQVLFYLFSLLAGTGAFVVCQMLFFRCLRLSFKRLLPVMAVPVIFVGFCVAVSLGLGLDTAHPKAEDVESAALYDSWFYGQARVNEGEIITGISKEDAPKFFDLQEAVIESIRANEYPYRMGARNHEINAADKQKVTLSYTGRISPNADGTAYKTYWIPKNSDDPAVQRAVGKALALRDAIACDADLVKSLLPINAIDALSDISGESWSTEGDKDLDPPVRALRLADDPEFRAQLERALTADFMAGRMLTDPDYETQEEETVKCFTLWYSSGKSFTARGGYLNGQAIAGQKLRLDSSFDFEVMETLTETYALLEPLFT